MKKALLLAVLALGLLSSTASGAVKAGSTEVIAADGSADHPYQRWVNQAEVPTPSSTITVEETTPCSIPGSLGCWDAAHSTIFFNPKSPLLIFVFRHELGHAFDGLLLDDAERATYQRLTGRPGTWPVEAFANSYAECAHRDSPKQRLARVCRLISSAYQE
jgi:hypothetical protein